MNIKSKVHIECLKKGFAMSDIAKQIGLNRHNYYFHLKKGTKNILRETEKVLGLDEGYFSTEE